MSWLKPDLSSFDDYFDKAKYLMVWRITITFFIVFSFVAVAYAATSDFGAIPAITVVFVTVFCFFYLKKTKKYKPVFWIYTIAGFVIIHASLNFNHELTHYIDFIWMVVCLFVAFIGLGKRVGFIFTGINFFLLIFFFFFSLNEHILKSVPRSNFQLFAEYAEMVLGLVILGYLIQLYFVFQHYSANKLKEAVNELEKQNLVISTKNEENIILIKEVHHRVKNNLQIITSLLRLQKSDLPENQEAEKKFDEAISRIMTMSLIHTKLYQSESLVKLNIKSYITDLINDIVQSLTSDKQVRTTFNSNIEDIGIKTIVPLGLLLNELLSNSFKHAFALTQNPEITINLTQLNEDEFELIYQDNGNWIEGDASRFKFGMELISTLTDQLEGELERKDSSYQFVLKNLDV
jgi:two-component system, sensor histidine kinase PdtaS